MRGLLALTDLQRLMPCDQPPRRFPASWTPWCCQGRVKPTAARYACMTRPEQSNADGPVPPHRYGLPSWASANPMAVEVSPFGAEPTPGTQSGAASTVIGLTENPPLA